MSGLDKLTKEELIALALKLHEITQLQARENEAQAQRIGELKATVARQAERISCLEEQISRHVGETKPHWLVANKPKKQTDWHDAIFCSSLVVRTNL